MSTSRTASYLMLLGNTILWGLAIPIVKKGFESGNLSPTVFLSSRFLLATILAIPILALRLRASGSRKKTSPIRRVFQPKTLATVIGIEAIGNVLALWFLYEGVARTSAIGSSLISATAPIFIIAGGVLFLREREERHEAVGLLIAILGTLVLAAGPLLSRTSTAGNTLGNILILLQNIATASYFLLAKRFYRGLDKWTIAVVSFILGTVSFSLLSIVGSSAPLVLPTGWGLLAVLYMAIGGSLLGLTLYLLGQDRIEASEAAVFVYLQPAVSIPMAMILLRESVHPVEIAGVILIAYGVIRAERRP